jgi:leader peptidase (prepilin peptidase)/N-methyltransferase
MDGTILVALAAAIGAAFGYAADRLAARWPAHDDGSIRPRDWRTWLVVITGGLAAAVAVARFEASPVHLAVVSVYVATLVVLFATDLDQKLLPNLLTYPLVLFAILVYVLGASPFLRSGDDFLWAAVAAVVAPVGLFLFAIPFGRDAIGEGDLKLLVSVGLFAGMQKLFYALLVGAFAAGIVVAILVVVRRLSLRSYVPYGPFLIAGALWAILALPQP